MKNICIIYIPISILSLSVLLLITLLLQPEVAISSTTCQHPDTGQNVTLNGTKVNVADFGANGLDEKDDDAAFSAAFECLDSVLNQHKTGYLYFPGGRYYLSEEHILEEKNNQNWKNITIFGEGAFQTTILARGTKNNMLTFSTISQNAKLTVRDFRLIAQNEDSANALTVSASSNSSVQHNVVIYDIDIHGEEEVASPGYFKNNIIVEGGSHPIVHDVDLRGTYTSAADSASVVATNCLVMSGIQDFTMMRSSCSFAESGLLFEGSGTVTVFNNHSYGVRTNTGLDFTMDGGVVIVRNMHVNAYRQNLAVSGADLVQIKNVLMLHRDETREHNLSNISITDTDVVEVLNSSFTTPRNSNSNPNRLTFDFGRGIQSITMHSNIFDEGNSLFRTKSAAVVIDDTNIISDRVQ